MAVFILTKSTNDKLFFFLPLSHFTRKDRDPESFSHVPLLDYKPSFCHFEPYPVRFEPITVLVVHAETNKIAHLCMNGPMDTNSVKNGATVTDMRQKLNYTDFRHGSRLA
jgi:hypothetical protein